MLTSAFQPMESTMFKSSSICGYTEILKWYLRNQSVCIFCEFNITSFPFFQVLMLLSSKLLHKTNLVNGYNFHTSYASKLTVYYQFLLKKSSLLTTINWLDYWISSFLRNCGRWERWEQKSWCYQTSCYRLNHHREKFRKLTFKR
mgnify:CR=1 FL=1